MLQRGLKGVFFLMPLLFGIGFIAPLVAELLALAGLRPLGLSPVGFGLVLGSLWGLYATVKGSWL